MLSGDYVCSSIYVSHLCAGVVVLTDNVTHEQTDGRNVPLYKITHLTLRSHHAVEAKKLFNFCR